MVAVASLVTAQPVAAAVQVAPVRDWPGTPAVSPVVVAVQPGAGALRGRVRLGPAWPARSSPACAAELGGVGRGLARLLGGLRGLGGRLLLCCGRARAGGDPRCLTRRGLGLLGLPREPARRRSCCCSATMSATTWPEPAEELVWAWQPLCDGGAATAGRCWRRPRWAARPAGAVQRVGAVAAGRPSYARCPSTRCRPRSPGSADAIDQLRRARHRRAAGVRARTRARSGPAGRPAGPAPAAPASAPGLPAPADRHPRPRRWSPSSDRVRGRARPHQRGDAVRVRARWTTPEFVTAWHTPPVTPAQEPLPRRAARIRRHARVGGAWPRR